VVVAVPVGYTVFVTLKPYIQPHSKKKNYEKLEIKKCLIFAPENKIFALWFMSRKKKKKQTEKHF
jgi:hypothetical protein